MMHPKPVDKPKRKKQNGYKDKATRYCYYTGASYAERHEVYGGANRQTSIDHGFQVDLSPEIHRRFHDPQTQEDRDRILYWQQYYQGQYESKLIESGLTPSQARNLWLLLIGRSYKEDIF